MYELIIFDLDGTLLYTLEDLHQSLIVALESHELPINDVEQTRRMVGDGIKKLIERAVPEDSSNELIENVYDAYNDHYLIHHKDFTKPYEGIVELLTQLREAGMKLAVVSNKNEYAVKPLVDHFFPGMFDVAKGVREGVSKKPAPDLVFEVLESLEMKPSQAIYIGDSEVDHLTAKNAGMDLILVSWGYRDVDCLKETGSDVILETVEELKKYVLR